MATRRYKYHDPQVFEKYYHDPWGTKYPCGRLKGAFHRIMYRNAFMRAMHYKLSKLANWKVVAIHANTVGRIYLN